MSGGERPPHAVLVRSPEDFSAPAVAAVLAQRAAVPVLDMIPVARRSWGLVAESLPAVEAEELAAALSAAGQDSVAVPTGLLEEVPPFVCATKAAFTSEGFDLLAGRENAAPESFSWTRLALLCAAALEVRHVSTPAGSSGVEMAERAVRLGLTLATGIPLMKGKSETKRTIESRDRRLVLDLVFSGPARRVRVDAEEFDYSVLGPRKGYGAELNFLALLEDLAARASKALRGRGTRALLARRPSADSLYESFDDLGREERWLLSLSALRA